MISSWICTKCSKNMLVKIVHPGGHIELHDRPVLAAEIMLRNPKCIVAYPHVFRQPWAIVAPDTMLLLGQKFYVVPISTIRKLQRRSYKYSASPIDSDVLQSTKTTNNNDKTESDISSTCWFFINKNINVPSCCLLQHSDRKLDVEREETTSSSGTSGSCETKGLTRNRNKELTRGSPDRVASPDHWQPNLDSIVEEQSN